MADAISLHHLTTHVRDQSDSHRANPALVYRRVPPGVVGELRIHGNAYDFYIPLAKLFHAVGMRKNFRGAHEGEVQRVKKQHRVFSGDGGAKVKCVVERPVGQNSGFCKIRGKMRNKYCHELSPNSLIDGWRTAI